MSLHGDSWCERCSKRAGKHCPPPPAWNTAESEYPPIYPISENFFRIEVPKVRTRYANASLRTDPWTRFNYHRPLWVIIVCLVIRSALRRFRKYYRHATLVRRVVLFHTLEINSLQTKGYTEISKLEGGRNPWCSDRLHHYAGNM